MAPPWMHPAMSNSAAGDIVVLNSKGNGTFLVRPYKNPEEQVLTVLFHNKPTHHLIQKDAEGKLTFNKKKFGDFDSLEAAIDALSGEGYKDSGWPVRLSYPVAPESVSEDPNPIESVPDGSVAQAAHPDPADSGSPGDSTEAPMNEEDQPTVSGTTKPEETIETTNQNESDGKPNAMNSADAGPTAQAPESGEMLLAQAQKQVESFYQNINSSDNGIEDSQVLNLAISEGDFNNLVQNVKQFHDNGTLPRKKAWSELKQDHSESITVSTVVNHFGRDRLKAELDPEFAAEMRDKKFKKLIAEEAPKKSKKELEAEAKKAEQDAAEYQKKLDQEDEARIAALPLWKQDKIRADRKRERERLEQVPKNVPQWKKDLQESKESKLANEPQTSRTQEKKSKVLLKRDELDMQEREKLRLRHEADEARKKEAAERKKAAEEAEEAERIKKLREEEEEQKILATMPPWKRALYLKKKRGESGGDTENKQMRTTKTFDSASTLLEKRRAMLEKEEEIAAQRSEQLKLLLESDQQRTEKQLDAVWGNLRVAKGAPNTIKTSPKPVAVEKAGDGPFNSLDGKLQELQERARRQSTALLNLVGQKTVLSTDSATAEEDDGNATVAKLVHDLPQPTQVADNDQKANAEDDTGEQSTKTDQQRKGDQEAAADAAKIKELLAAQQAAHKKLLEDQMKMTQHLQFKAQYMQRQHEAALLEQRKISRESAFARHLQESYTPNAGWQIPESPTKLGPSPSARGKRGSTTSQERSVREQIVADRQQVIQRMAHNKKQDALQRMETASVGSSPTSIKRREKSIGGRYAPKTTLQGWDHDDAIARIRQNSMSAGIDRLDENDLSSSISTDRREAIARIAARAREASAEAGSSSRVDGSQGIFVVEGQYLNRDGTYANTKEEEVSLNFTTANRAGSKRQSIGIMHQPKYID